MRKWTAFLFTLVLIVALYVGVALLTFRLYFRLPLYIVIVVAMILAIILALLSFLLREPVQVFVEQIFYRETYEHRQILLNFASRMGNILNPDQLAQEMLSTLSKALCISQVVLLLEDQGNGSFTTQFVYPKPKDKPDNELRLLLGNPIILWLQKESTPLNGQQIESIVELNGVDSLERDALSSLELICPLKSHGKLIGILGLGKKQSNKLYSQEDLEIIVNIMSQAGIILENALLFHDIVRDATELKALNEKLMDLDKLRTESLSKQLSELQSPLIAIKDELESMLSEKYCKITTDQGTQLQRLLDLVNEKRKIVETMQVRLLC